jgi:hypothetical protein
MEELGEGVGLAALPTKWVSCSCWVFLALFLVFSWIFSRFLLSFLLRILTIWYLLREMVEHAIVVGGGRGTEMVLALAAINYVEALHHDRFCRRWSRLPNTATTIWASDYPDVVGGQEDIIKPVHFDGWVAIDPSILVP